MFIIEGLLLYICCCSVTQSPLTLCNPMHCSTPGFPVLHHLLEFAQTPVHCVSDAIQPSHPLSSPSPPAFNLSQHQGLFQCVSSWHQVARVLKLQLQHQSWFPFVHYKIIPEEQTLLNYRKFQNYHLLLLYHVLWSSHVKQSLWREYSHYCH